MRSKAFRDIIAQCKNIDVKDRVGYENLAGEMLKLFSPIFSTFGDGMTHGEKCDVNSERATYIMHICIKWSSTKPAYYWPILLTLPFLDRAMEATHKKDSVKR